MSTWTVVGLIVAGAVAVLGLALVGLLAWRGSRARRRLPAGAAGHLVSRRQIAEQGLIALFVAALAGVVSSVLAFLWPTFTGRSGRRYALGSAESVRQKLTSGRPYYDKDGGFYLVPYPAADLPAARRAYTGPVVAGMEVGFVALSPRCTHQGCHVPYCDTSHWFECPCHGSRFDEVGEQRRGPAPRGLDRYRVTIDGGQVVVDTRLRYDGPPPGTNTTGQPAAGRHCN